jgi:hypothetical protein
MALWFSSDGSFLQYYLVLSVMNIGVCIFVTIEQIILQPSNPPQIKMTMFYIKNSTVIVIFIGNQPAVLRFLAFL